MPARALFYCGLFVLLIAGACSPAAKGGLTALPQAGPTPGTVPGTLPGTIPGTVPGTVPGGPEAVVLAALAGWDAEEVDEATLEASLAYFAGDAVYYVMGLPTGPETYAGKASIRGWRRGLLAQGFRLRAEVLSVDATGGNDGTVVTLTETWTDATRRAGIAPLIALEAYMVEDGLIRQVVWSLTEGSAAELEGQ